MRRINLLLAVVVLAAVSACQGTTVPERREILGSWVSRDFPAATIRMTLGETAREIVGAGSLVTPAEADAFEVSGAVAADEVSLLLRFANRNDVNFQGYFEDDDVLVGLLTGAGFRRDPITFDREDLQED